MWAAAAINCNGHVKMVVVVAVAGGGYDIGDDN